MIHCEYISRPVFAHECDAGAEVEITVIEEHKSDWEIFIQSSLITKGDLNYEN